MITYKKKIVLLTNLILITIGHVDMTILTGKINYHVQGEEMSTKLCDWSADNVDPGNSCTYTISNSSRDTFVNLVNKGNDFIYFILNVEKGTSIIKETKCVIEPLHWIWTSVKRVYLKMPVGFDVWSAGTLSVSVAGPIDINITEHGDCDLIIGEQNSTTQLARAFKSLGEALDLNTDKNINSLTSYFCYIERFHIKSNLFYRLCKHVVCPIEAIGYRCCRYLSHRPDSFKCFPSKLSFDFWWWMFPFILGIILFAFVPLLLMSQAEKIYLYIHCGKYMNISVTDEKESLLISRTKDYRSINIDTERHTPLETIGTSSFTLNSNRKQTFILETNVRPVTLTSIIVLQIMKCFSFKTVLLSRVTRALFPLISLPLVALNITLLYVFHKEFIVAAVKKGVPMGFPTIIADINNSTRTFLPYLGGTYVACIMYITGGAVLISLPRDFANFLQEALPENYDISMLVFSLEQATIQKFGCVQILTKRGYHKVYNQMSAQFFMLLNPAFWKYAVSIQVQRWKVFIDRYANVNLVIVGLGLFFAFIPYILICVLEISLTILYYGFPIVNFTHTFVRAYFVKIRGTSNKRKIIRLMRIILACVVSLFAIFIIYMFSIIFVESFLFLTRMVIYTYTGMFTRPEECYGYVIFGIMVLFYLWESVNQIGNVYQTLLKDIIVISQSLQSKSNGKGRNYIYYEDDVIGIPEELFEFVVDRHKPRMKALFVSAMKVLIIIILILLSVQILLTFHGVAKLYLFTHIFQAICICMVPKLLTSCCSGSDKQIAQKYYRRELEQSIKTFWRNWQNLKPESKTEFHQKGNSSDSKLDGDIEIYISDNANQRNSEDEDEDEDELNHLTSRLAEWNVDS